MNHPRRVDCWQMVAPGEPMVPATRTLGEISPDDAVIEVAGCGVCHTDLGFLFGGVRTRQPLPLTLGHEISGRVVEGPPALLGRAVVVPAVTPCGTCAACLTGRGAICRKQYFPGNDGHGGFASHVVVPARGLCVVDEAALAGAGLDLADLAVIADAATTPYQAIVNAGGLAPGDLAIFVGAGGVGTFGVQIAHALGAAVVALDVDAARLDALAGHGADLCLDAGGDPRALRTAITDFAKARGLPRAGWKIFETSGRPAGQTLAFSLLTYGAHLGIVGYTMAKVEVRLSNLMAFDATARGTWGCLPEHYPAVVDLALRGAIAVTPFVERRPLSSINETFTALNAHALRRRPVLVPDFAAPATGGKENPS